MGPGPLELEIFSGILSRLGILKIHNFETFL
jgi:hypothetical protein